MTAEAATNTGEHTIDLRISYNGVIKELEHVALNESVQALLQRAIALFQGVERPHQEGLYREDGSEVLTSDSVSGAHLQDAQLLILRPRTVQGG